MPCPPCGFRDPDRQRDWCPRSLRVVPAIDVVAGFAARFRPPIVKLRIFKKSDRFACCPDLAERLSAQCPHALARRKNPAACSGGSSSAALTQDELCNTNSI